MYVVYSIILDSNREVRKDKMPSSVCSFVLFTFCFSQPRLARTELQTEEKFIMESMSRKFEFDRRCCAGGTISQPQLFPRYLKAATAGNSAPQFIVSAMEIDYLFKTSSTLR